MIDELGIGVIRDSFADRMFPGISTVQTRPKYFTLTAHLLKDYAENELSKPRPRSLPKYLEDEEKWCRIELVKTHGEGRQNLGIIGGTLWKRLEPGCGQKALVDLLDRLEAVWLHHSRESFPR